MSDSWNQWEGQLVDQKYHLQRYLGSTDHSAVFLAEQKDAQPRQVAIKFVSAEVSGREQQLSVWNDVAKLSHPNLIRIHGSGVCRIEDMDLLYVAMDFAEENLSQVLPHRALTPDEAKEMLKAVTDVLLYLHAKDLTHGHIKPSNVLADGEVLKLSSDTIFRAGENREMLRERSAYDAPELPDAPYSPGADVWSLGVTLVEIFSQQPAILPFNENADPVIPAGIREPFLDICRHTLKRKPSQRWNSTIIAERLNPAAATVAAARTVAAGVGATTPTAVASATHAAIAAFTPAPTVASVAALEVPLSKEPAVPLSRQTKAPSLSDSPRRSGGQEAGQESKTLSLPSYAIPVFAGALAVIALIVLVFVLRHRAPASNADTATVAPLPAESSNPSVAVSSTKPSSPPATTSNLPPGPTAPKTATNPKPPAPAEAKNDNAITPSPSAPENSADSSANLAGKTSSDAGSKGDVLDQVKPAVSARSLSTIHGTVRVSVKVHVDAAGNVSTAAIDDAGPSHYFADLSLKAAQKWVFTPPDESGRSIPSDWLLQFHFTSSGVEMASRQLTP